MLWSPKEIEVVKLKDEWTLAERTLMRGDIVVLGEDANGQMGTVTEVHSFMELGHVYGDDKPIYRCVPSALLYPSTEWRFELAVARNGWIGSVSRFCWRLRVQLETSDTILTIDTWSVGTSPITLSRRESPVLKDQPAEGRYFVGTTIAFSVQSPIENVEGDLEWISKAAARTEFPDDYTVPEHLRSTHVIGTIISSELSGVVVCWVDHAQGDCAGTTRPHCHQALQDINIVDPYFHNSLGRYEVTWATPEIREHYVGNDHFCFPDGTRIHRDIIDKYQQEKALKSESSNNEKMDGNTNLDTSTTIDQSESETSTTQTASTSESAPQSTSQGQDTTFSSAFMPPPPDPTSKKPIFSFQQYAALFEHRHRKVPISSSSFFTKWTEHPDKTAATTTGPYERVMADYEVSRRSSPLMAPYAAKKGGYEEDDLLYVRSVTCFVDVQWQDGRTTKKHLSIDLHPYLFLGETDFQPNDYVQSVPVTVEETEKARLAVIQSVDHVNRVATVWWVGEDSIEPHVSIYMLEDADGSYHYRIGYFVLRVLLPHETCFEGTVGLVDNMDDRGRVYVLWVEGTSGWYYPCQLMPFDMGDYDLTPPDETNAPTEELLHGDEKDDQIRYLTRQYIQPDQEDETEWESESLAGETTELPRAQLYISCNNAGEEAEEADDEEDGEIDDDDDDDLETESESATAENVSSNEDGENEEDEEEEDEAMDGTSEEMVDKFDIGEESELYPVLDGESSDPENIEDALVALTIDQSLKEHGAKQYGSLKSRKDGSDEETCDEDDDSVELDPSAAFRFAEEAPENHHYHSYRPSNSSTLPKLAMKEWKLLEDATLDGAYVMAYENRVDLFRFLVLGAHGTPFYLSWFMFDLQLDAGHPAHPPRVHFHSLGPKLHPNLYEDGNVCLSLLGTWNGEGVEVWDPQHSSVLQVVLSIQGLILGVKEPYYLEAGYDKHRGTTEGVTNSLVYNERSFLLSVQQMKKLIERPPPEFRELILASFRQNRHIILDLEKALSTDPTVLATVDMTMFGLPKGPPSLGFVSAFKSIFPSVKRVLESISDA